ncbi:MAG: ferritin family protein [Planctomycetota bacterium]|jgi:rubrerythrin
MAVSFNADEVLEMALQIERNGGRFYRRAAEQAQDPGVKQILAELAEMEADHEDLFAQLQASLSEGAAPPLDYDPNADAALYLQAAAESHVFNVRREGPDVLSGLGGPREVLKKAIEFEKDSVVFFLGLKEMVPEGLGRQDVDELIKEEMSHITMLSEALERLGGDA